ncbi:tol-pal system protein YbgF [Bradyrhizobium sp.]|uniref:tol-pal system protein YbgF n=1 Tax=Bradyrhizobium sp. TaxID=376 RepID=UPI002D2B9A24|nr:tol-pal system protein YbgF [Bradyrhizobium sp.]HZR76570.1 tol-pal system protein YbgF [Bradyrhizobium sp.]
MSPTIHRTTRAAASAVLLGLSALAWSAPALAQSDEVDPEVRIQQLEGQLRQLTGQNEELQYRNRQLEERLRMLQGNAQPGAPGQAGSPAPVANAAALPPAQPGPGGYQPPPGGYQSAPGGYPSQVAAPAPIVQEQASPRGGGRRGDAFDPTQNPNAPGAPRALGGGQMPISPDAPIGAPGGRGAGGPLDIANNGGASGAGLPPPPPRNTNATGALTTLPPSATPRDEFDLGVGYIERKDYALAEETMRNFTRKYPADPLVADAQFWLGESFFQRQSYREAAEAFLSVTTKYDRSAKAPDALLRLGQSLAALKEKEAACAAFGEVTRKYPRAAGSIKSTVEREQKRTKC